MKYLVKNITSGEETICEKVVVGGFDYYIKSTESGNCTELKKIATNNPSLDLPQVVDEVEELAENYARWTWGVYYNNIDKDSNETKGNNSINDYKEGYSKAKKTFEYTKEDMVELIQSLKDYTHESNNILGHDERDAEEFFDIWQEQRIKTILVK